MIQCFFHFSFHFIIKYLLLRVYNLHSFALYKIYVIYHTHIVCYTVYNIHCICIVYTTHNTHMIFMNYSLWISVTRREQRSHCIFSNSMDLFFVKKILQVTCSTMCFEDDANYYQMNDCMCVNFCFGNRNLMLFFVSLV